MVGLVRNPDLGFPGDVRRVSAKGSDIEECGHVELFRWALSEHFSYFVVAFRRDRTVGRHGFDEVEPVASFPIENDVGELVVLGDWYAQFGKPIGLTNNVLESGVANINDSGAWREAGAELLDNSNLEFVVFTW